MNQQKKSMERGFYRFFLESYNKVSKEKSRMISSAFLLSWDWVPWCGSW